MRIEKLVRTFAPAAALVASAAVALAGITVKIVRGEATAPQPEGTAEATFRLLDAERNGEAFQKLVVAARGLDAGEVAEPQYHVVLDNGTQTADLGTLRLSPSGTRGWFRFDTRRDALPEGLSGLEPFSGGTLRIQLDGADVATGAIPVFVDPEGPDQTSEEPTGTIAFGAGSTVLGDPFAWPVAKLDAFAVNTWLGLNQGMVFKAVGLERDGEYTLVLAGDPEDVLGTFTARGWLGFGSVFLSTRRGDTVPGGSIGALAGRGVELRDAGGSVVLSGTFPSLR